MNINKINRQVNFNLLLKRLTTYIFRLNLNARSFREGTSVSKKDIILLYHE